MEMPKYILSYTKKKKLCRIHLKGGCWRKPGIDYKDFEYVYELEDLAKVAPFCKDCLNSGKGGSSSDTSSSTASDVDTEDEEKKEEARRKEEDRQITKIMIANLEKEEGPSKRRKRSPQREAEVDMIEQPGVEQELSGVLEDEFL